MSSLHIFLGAPSRSDLENVDDLEYSWQTVTVRPTSTPASESAPVLPPATLAAAGRRLSAIYGNMIFKDEEDEPNLEESDMTRDHAHGATTFMTWAPTQHVGTQRRTEDDLTFLRTRSGIDLDAGQDTQRSGDGTYDMTDTTDSYSDASSIGRLPAFHFSLHSLTSMSSLTKQAAASRSKSSRKVAMLVAALEVEALDAITIKKGADAGQEVSLLKMVVGDESCASKLVAWRDVADEWGASSHGRSVQRGDVILLENIQASFDPSSSSAALTLAASPYNKPNMTICYRTMPHAPVDQRLRPDLRLGISEPSVRRVQEVVMWFERMAGLR